MTPPRVRFILERINRSGHQAFLVGGAVRDALLGRAFHDVDVLSDADPETLRSLFANENARVVGKQFSVCLVQGIEISSGRDQSNLFGSLEDFPASDLALRDFTINAMAWEPFKKTLFDPFQGKKDLNDRIIRFTGDAQQRIQEDPVRLVRACRFAALIGGTLADDTGAALSRNAQLLAHAAPERIGAEVLKAMPLDTPSIFFNLLQRHGLLPRIFPSLSRCYTLEGGPFHGETVFEHCLLAGDAISPKYPLLRLAAYLHDTGKFDAAITKEDGSLSFPEHHRYTDALVADLEALRFSVKDITYITAVVSAHMRPLKPKSTPRAVRRLLAMLADKHLSHTDFMRMRIADKKSNLAKPAYNLTDIRIRFKMLLEEMNRSDCFKEADLAISGQDIMGLLNLSPGPEVGRIKAFLFEKVLDEPELNTRETLEELCSSLGKVTTDETGE